MSKVLCIQAFDQLSSLVNKTAETVEAKMLDITSKEVQEQGYKPLISYVTFYNVDAERGALNIFQVQHHNKQEGEETTPGGTSIGFRGDISEESDIVCDQTSVDEEGTKSFDLTLAGTIQTGLNAVERSIKTVLGVDLKQVLGVVDLGGLPSAFMDATFNDERHAYELGFSVLVKLDAEQFEKIRQEVAAREIPFKAFDAMSVKLDLIVEEMDLTVTLGRICQDLQEKHGMEEWSCKVLSYATRIAIYEALRTVTYADMVQIVKFKKAAEEAAELTSENAEQASVAEVESVSVEAALTSTEVADAQG